MPTQKDLKRLIRARMHKTGESYTAARTRILAKTLPLPKDYAKLAGKSDEAVKKATGKTWREWTKILDDADAATLEHGAIVRRIVAEHPSVSGWWAQMVTVAYERFRGLRDVGQRRGGGYEVSKSRTLPVSQEALWSRLTDAKQRRRWLPEVALAPSRAKLAKTLRAGMDDGTKVAVYLTSKGDAKTTLTVQHTGLPDKDAAERTRAFWGERLEALQELLAGR